MTLCDTEDVLRCGMAHPSKLFIVAVLAMFASAAAAETSGCKECDPQKEENSHREQIKADRAKYDHENEKVTTRPWDVSKDDKTLPDRNK